MIFNDHSKLAGQHAFLGASNFRWINWDEATLEKRLYGQYASTIGTLIHELAKDLISFRIKLTKADKRMIELHLAKNNIPLGAYDSEKILANLLPFVNDAIGFRMTPEVILFYSYNAFGTTDAIGFSERENILRINDLKNGITPAYMDQPIMYSALYCLEYKKNPKDFVTELRIYQNIETQPGSGIYEPGVLFYSPAPEEIQSFMDAIVKGDILVQKYLERNRRR